MQSETLVYPKVTWSAAPGGEGGAESKMEAAMRAVENFIVQI